MWEHSVEIDHGQHINMNIEQLDGNVTDCEICRVKNYKYAEGTSSNSVIVFMLRCNSDFKYKEKMNIDHTYYHWNMGLKI